MRRDILERRAEIIGWIAEGRPKAFMCRELHCKPETLEGYLKRMGLGYKGNKGGRGKIARNRKPASEHLYEGSTIRSHRLKLTLLRDGLKTSQCEECQGSEWLGKPMPLELHHINGNPF